MPSCSEPEAYFTRYVPAFAKVTAGQGIALQWLGAVGAVLVAGGAEGWDDIALIRYPDFATFRRMVGGADYQETAELHRLAALADWRLCASRRRALRPDRVCHAETKTLRPLAASQKAVSARSIGPRVPLHAPLSPRQ